MPLAHGVPLDAEVGPGIDVLHQLDPGAAVDAVGLVEPQLLLHVAVGQVVDQVLVADPDIAWQSPRPLRAVRDRRGVRVARLLLEVDVTVVAHARADAAGVAQVRRLGADGAVVAARDADHATVRGAGVVDAAEVHRDLDVVPLRDARGIVDVHARHRPADLEHAGAVDGVVGVAMVCVEPVVAGVDAAERARATGVPLRHPALSAGQRREQHADAEAIERGGAAARSRGADPRSRGAARGACRAAAAAASGRACHAAVAAASGCAHRAAAARCAAARSAPARAAACARCASRRAAACSRAATCRSTATTATTATAAPSATAAAAARGAGSAAAAARRRSRGTVGAG